MDRRIDALLLLLCLCLLLLGPRRLDLDTRNGLVAHVPATGLTDCSASSLPSPGPRDDVSHPPSSKSALGAGPASGHGSRRSMSGRRLGGRRVDVDGLHVPQRQALRQGLHTHMRKHEPRPCMPCDSSAAAGPSEAVATVHRPHSPVAPGRRGWVRRPIMT